jgi:uncharacterized protein YndB with AHSA1/START domain
MSETERRDKAVYRVTIRGTVDQVWQELTRTDRPQGAMFNSMMHFDVLAAGGQLRMRSPNGKQTAVAGTFIEVREPVRLSHTLRFTSYDDPECTIVYDLEEVAEGVELTLTVEDLPTGTKSEKQLKQGGPFIVKNLKAIIETGRPTLGARLLYLLFGLLAPLNPKSTRSENWPLEASKK